MAIQACVVSPGREPLSAGCAWGPAPSAQTCAIPCRKLQEIKSYQGPLEHGEPEVCAFRDMKQKLAAGFIPPADEQAGASESERHLPGQ